MLALLFPGQGSQAVGMGAALVERYPLARATFAEADDALGEALSTLCFQGPEAELRRTEITQPALLTVSVALFRVLESLRPLEVALVAGHSLGEWSALVAAGALSFPDAIRAVRERGRAMQAAVPEGEGAMSAVLGLAPEAVLAVCAEIEAAGPGTVRAANFNSPEQTVISGSAAAVAAAGDALLAKGAKRVVALPVSAPFHCPLMAPAAERMAAVLAEITVSAPRWPVVTNVEAAPTRDPERIRALLVEQVTAPVRWVESVQTMRNLGVSEAFELGPGKVLMGLIRRIDRGLKVTPVEDPTSLEAQLA